MHVFLTKNFRSKSLDACENQLIYPLAENANETFQICITYLEYMYVSILYSAPKIITISWYSLCSLTYSI